MFPANSYGLTFNKKVLFQNDTTKSDTVDAPYEPVTQPTYQPKDRFGDPFSNRLTRSPFYFSSPPGLNLGLEIDTGFNYTIYEKIGDMNYRPTSEMTFEEFKEYREREILKSYWKGRSAGLDGESAVSGRNIIPPIYISPVLDRIFGGSTVEIIPTGFVTLDFGGRWQRIDNPNIDIRQQRNGGFEFDQQISMNVVGKIGDKMAVTANFDNNNSFDFENNLKVEYTGYKEDILKKLEVGNVSLPLNNSLITGAQNLFGIKAQMQFGKVYVTALASQQRGKTEQIEIEGGSGQGRQFDIPGSDYDENRHFFLGHFFRNNYEQWLSTLPQVTSGVNITRLEVYVVNRNNDTQSLRNVVGVMDMGEPYNIYTPNINNPNVVPNPGNVPGSRTDPNDNSANQVYSVLTSLTPGERDVDNINAVLEGMGLENGTDFEKINSARKLSPEEYTINYELGYMNLYRRLQNDEALAVSYEYTYNGRRYKVGELSEDYSTRPEDEAIFLKLLRPRKINIRDAAGNEVPTWDLMMRNIYSLNATNVSRDGFQMRIIYRDDRTGIDNPQLQEGVVARTKQLLEIFGLDRLNPNNDPQRDGNFDFVEGVTIDTKNGYIMFPYTEPFNTALRQVFRDDPKEEFLIDKYVYDTLYNTTKAEAELDANKNKFFLVGSVQAGNSTEIDIPGINISENSVRVYAGGSPLREGVDYHVDYNFGRVNIINDGVLNSGKKLTITYEKADPFNLQTRTLLGTRFDYSPIKDINIGATVLHMNERPIVTRIGIGNEPARNTKYGFDVNMRKESRFITKAIDLIPLIQTKESSIINLNTEFAQLLPGTSNIVDGEGTSYIDDFEFSATPINLGNPMSWSLSSVPQTEDNRFDISGGARNDITWGYRRAKLAWYGIDNIFYRNTGRNRPENITADDLNNHYVRAIPPQEIFPQRDLNVINVNERVFDLAYYPNERGPYNYNPNLDPDGSLSNPKQAWGGITTAIRNEVDFDKSNIEYIEFWMMDPFIDSEYGVVDDGRENPQPLRNGGDMYFNLGSISEDIIRDGKHGFENGLPRDGSLDGVDTSSPISNVTTQQYLTDAFANSPEARRNQDVGLDGLSNDRELTKFNDFLQSVPATALTEIQRDPSADNFKYFLGSDLDQNGATVLERYKNFNGTDGNSPVLTADDQYAASGSTNPDNEDINNDNTLSELEEYYEYRVRIRPDQMKVGQNHIVDQVVHNHEDTGDEVKWYLFRIPIRQFDDKFGNISGFKSMRYLRMYMTNFEEPAVVRLANFRFVGNKWRRYTGILEEPRFGEPLEPNLDNFTVSVVNIEENGQGNDEQSPYVLPPEFNRDRDNTSPVNRRRNEQSIQMCIDGLEDNDARSIFKNVNLDLINYGRMKMFLHADSDAEDDELVAFVRLGTDFNQNYYEIEVPLKITDPSATSSRDIWPLENEIDIDLGELLGLKSGRSKDGAPITELYPVTGPKQVGRHGIRLLGRPKLSDIRTIMIGVKNPESADKRPISVCIWANELRVTDFDRTPGWAVSSIANIKLADLANITATARHTTFGFGRIQARIPERTREETTSYDVTANVSLDKFLPEKAGVQLPMYVSYERNHVKPRFDPLDPDIPLDASLTALPVERRDAYRASVEDVSERKSINFSNIRKVKTNPDARNHLWDIENLSLTYSYSEMTQSDYKTQGYLRREYRGMIAYNYTSDIQPFEPFNDWKRLNSPWLRLIKDINFNPLPNNISLRGNVDRRFIRTIFRDEILNEGSQANFEKYFTFNRNYGIRWDITKALSFDYSAFANAIIDEPQGDINTEEKIDSVIVNAKNLGRMKNFNQTASVTYTLPFSKIPITDWLSADYQYEAGFSWRAGPINQPDSLKFGNIIENSRTNDLSAKIDMVKLYNKISFLQEINSPPRSRSRTTRTDTVKVQRPEMKAVKGLARLLMMVRSINGTYSLNEGTGLPGYSKSPVFFGLDSTFSKPGLNFIAGSQDPNFRFDMRDRNLLVTSNIITTPFTQTKAENISVRARIEPFSDFDIQIDIKKDKNAQFKEIFRDTIPGDEIGFGSLNPSRSGSYSISFLSFNTSFIPDDDENNSPVFAEFERNLEVIKGRYNSVTGISAENKTQDVLIPAFIAAYSGKDVNQVNLSPFPNIPLPNWRIDYNGLSRLDGIKDVFQSISIKHSYRSSYSVMNFTNSLEYDNQDGIGLDNDVENYNRGIFSYKTNDAGSVIPIYIINQVMISEQFAPLIGVSIRTKTRFTAGIDLKKKRDVALNLSNTQVTELKSNDVSMEVGYTKDNFRIPFRIQGRYIILKNDLTFRFNLTIRDTETIQRKIEESSTITNGNVNFQLRPNISYVVNEKLNLQFYFDRTINDPKVTPPSFRRATTRFGVQVRFSLAQ